MRIFITGGTGFIGQALCSALIKEGHHLTVLSRQKTDNRQAVCFCQNLAEFKHFNEFDAVINLAGEPIFDRPWTPKQKQRLNDSRVALTQALVERIQRSQTPPQTFISGSASGFYGNLSPTKIYDEQTACSRQFSGQLDQWEQTARQAEGYSRVCLLRTGMVLDQQGGVLKRMLPLYRLGLAGKLGTGKQHWAWISLTDQVRAILFLLKTPNCRGAYNLVAPELLTNADFNRRLAAVLKRPAFFSVPAFLLQMVFGERSQLLLDNQPLVPQKLLNEGFRFCHSAFSGFLSHQFGKESGF